MNIKILDKNGITLKTQGKRVLTDISIELDTTNLVAENIKKGVTILGVEGNCASGGSGSSSVSVENTTLIISENAVTDTTVDFDN